MTSVLRTYMIALHTQNLLFFNHGKIKIKFVYIISFKNHYRTQSTTRFCVILYFSTFDSYIFCLHSTQCYNLVVLNFLQHLHARLHPVIFILLGVVMIQYTIMLFDLKLIVRVTTTYTCKYRLMKHFKVKRRKICVGEGPSY